MNVKDAGAIKHATAIKEYCGGRINCQDCVFGERDGSCDLEKSLPVDESIRQDDTAEHDDAIYNMKANVFKRLAIAEHERNQYAGGGNE